MDFTFLTSGCCSSFECSDGFKTAFKTVKKTMPSNRTFTTMEELERSANIPTLRLTLTDGANNLHASNSSNNHRQQSFLKHLRQRMNNLFGTERTVNLEDSGSEEALRRNQERVDRIFDDLQNDLNKQRDEVKREMTDLTPEQQEDVITFWSGVQTFFKDIMTWLKNMFAAVLERIRQGFRLVKKVVVEIFQTFGNWIKSLFG